MAERTDRKRLIEYVSSIVIAESLSVYLLLKNSRLGDQLNLPPD